MSVSTKLLESLAERAKTAEETIESLEREVKQLTVTKVLSDLKAENLTLKNEVASLICKLQILEKTNKRGMIKEFTALRLLRELKTENESLKNEAGFLANQREIAERISAKEKVSTVLEDFRSLKKITRSVKPPSRKVEFVPAERDVPENKETELKQKNTEKSNSDKQKQKEEKKDSGGKSKGDKTQKSDASEDQSPDIGKLDLRVGKIINIKKHPDADSLYVEEIDVGEEKPRTIVSGLVKHVSLEEMQNRLVVVLCNLKPAKMRGVTSEGMVMCASTPEKVEVLVPPETCVPGDEIIVEGFNRNPEAVLNPKKKIFETVAVYLKTNKDKIATYKGVPLSVAGKGVITTPTLINVFIK